MASEPFLTSAIDGETLLLSAAGSWTATHAGKADRLVDGVASRAANARSVVVDTGGIEALDTFGAWLLERLVRDSTGRGQQAQLVALPSHYRGLLEEVHQANRREPAPRDTRNRFVRAIDRTGDALSALRDDALAIPDSLDGLLDPPRRQTLLSPRLSWFPGDFCRAVSRPPQRLQTREIGSIFSRSPPHGSASVIWWRGDGIPSTRPG